MNSEPARILVSHGNSGVAELPDGTRRRCQYRRSVGRPYCGDRVLTESADDTSLVVTQILPRENEFLRAGARGRKQVIAANLSQVCIVLAPAPEPSRDLLERYLVAVQTMGSRALIVLNKAELMATAGLSGGSPLRRIDEYRELGYDVVPTSCKGPPGVTELEPLLVRETSILVGQSGVGKSSLVNALLPDLELQTGELSRVTGKGTHTTTSTVMHTLPCGGRLVDSPGVWEYGLWTLEPGELAAGFRDFRAVDEPCRFNDCRHAGEPGCAVALAAEQGRIKAWRYEAYLRLLEQET
jgi:ribosome biogenesis GTPase